MKSYLTFIFLMFFGVFSAQYQPDYIVKLYNDTIKTAFDLVASEDRMTADARVRVKIDGKKQIFEPHQLQAIYYVGGHYEPVFFEGKWIFMRREISGDVTVYNNVTPTILADYERLRYYFRQKYQPRGEIKELSLKELRNVSTYYCEPVMDSLINVTNNTSVFLPDLIKEYNERCP